MSLPPIPPLSVDVSLNKDILIDMISNIRDTDTIRVDYHGDFVCRLKYNKSNDTVITLEWQGFKLFYHDSIPKPIKEFMFSLYMHSKYNGVTRELTNKLSDLYENQIDNSEFTYTLEH